MRIDSELVIRKVAGETILIPTGKVAKDNPGLITLTESGELLVRKLQEGCEFNDLVTTLMEKYEVEQDRAEQDVKRFLGKLKERGLL
ncbi:MAG: PqqD family protein [Clostridiales bacterium]|nr:PqqD family protein [Clostridiales bacterium]